jgi:DNA mismatch repair protein MutS2
VALTAADEERRKARRERDESLKAARDEAERVVDEVRAEVRGIRRQLERETITQRSLDEGLERARAHVERLPAPEPEPARVAPAVPVEWHIGMRARNTTAGWEGRIVALEKGGKRATIEAGGMRVTVAVADLELATGGDRDSATGAGRSRADGIAMATSGSASRLQIERARTVASSLDLRGAKVEEALEALDRYLDDASLAGLDQAIVIHGMGTGALRDAVRDHAAAHPLVKSWRAGGRGEGGDGATVVTF